jgi:hypothetical protein
VAQPVTAPRAMQNRSVPPQKNPRKRRIALCPFRAVTVRLVLTPRGCPPLLASPRDQWLNSSSAGGVVHRRDVVPLPIGLANPPAPDADMHTEVIALIERIISSTKSQQVL